MRSFLSIVFAFLIALPGQSQNTVGKGNVIPVVGYWHLGKTKKVQYTNTKTTVKNGKAKTETITCNATWKIADSTEKNYIIHYTYNSFSSSNPNDSFMMAYFEVLKGVTLKYRTSETGVFDTILNMDEVIKRSKTGLDMAFKRLKWPANAVTKGIADKISVLLNNPHLMYSSFSEEMVIIHYFHGLEYKLNTPYTYDIALDNPWGGEYYPSKAVFKLTAINAAADKIKLNATVTPVPAEYKRILYETLVELANQIQAPKPKKTDLETSTVIQKCEAELSLAECWPLKLTFTKISTLKTDKNTETITITFTD